jgi:hypothetical protein
LYGSSQRKSEFAFRDVNLFRRAQLSRSEKQTNIDRKKSADMIPFSFVIERLNRVVKSNYYEISTKKRDEENMFTESYVSLCGGVVENFTLNC